jgi:hypothetical protein
MERCETEMLDAQILHEMLARSDKELQIARRTSSNAWVYVMAAPGVEAVRIGRTIDLPQRMRSHAHKNGRIQDILLGQCNALDPEGRRAEEEIFRLLDDVHLRKHNFQLHLDLVLAGTGRDWYLPDRHKIWDAFWSLRRGNAPRFVRVKPDPTFERFTNVYPPYATPDQIIRVVDDL